MQATRATTISVVVVSDDAAFARRLSAAVRAGDGDGGLAWSVAVVPAGLVHAEVGGDRDIVLVDDGVLTSLGHGAADGPMARIVALAGDAPVVLLQTCADWQDRVEAVSAGAADVVHRDAVDDPALLRRVLDRVIELATVRRTARETGRELEHERELRRFATLEPDAPATAVAMGDGPLRDRSQQLWGRLVDEYQRILRVAYEARHYAVDEDPGADTRALAVVLANAGARPADVVALHGQAVERLSSSHTGRARADLLDESRLRLVQLMGSLAGIYRAQRVGGAR